MADKINVLFIQSQMALGADSLIHVHLMRYLDRERFRVHVACTEGDGSGTPPSLAAIERIPDIHLRRTCFAPGFSQRSREAIARGVRAGSRFPIDFAALAAYVRRERIQLLHTTEKPRDGVYAVTLGRVTGAKSIVHVHVKWSDEYSRAARWAVANASAVFSISDYVTGTIFGMGVPKSRIYTVLNCLDASNWDSEIDGSSIRREFGVAADAPLLASVSRLFSWKGQRELVKALAIVKKEVPGVKLMIVGEDERYVHGGSFTAELTTLAQEHGVADDVIFTGGRRDVAQIMAACDVYTMPSFEEPFGVVFLEAMAMKRPIIAVDNGGTPEVVDNGRAGLLSPPWDVPALAANIVTLLKNPELRRRMGEHGRARVLDYFNPLRMARDAGAAYEAILGA